MTDAAQEAAAGLVMEYVNQAAEAELGEQERQASEQPTETTEQQEVEEEEIPAEIRRLLEEPDLDDEEDIDTSPVAEEESYFDDEDVDGLKRQLAKEQKRRAYLEDKQRAEALKKARKDAERYFPHADTDSIQATSRRGYLKQAREQHDRIKAAVDKATEKERAALEAERERLAAESKQGRVDGWGQSVESVGAPGATRTDPRDTTSRNASTSFYEATRNRLANGDIKL